MKKFWFVSATLAIFLVLAACAAPAPATVIVTSAPVVQTVIQTAESSQGSQEIAVIVKTGNSSFWQNVQTGAMDAQSELKKDMPKMTVTFLGAQSESNINEQINIVESAIDRGVKAIVLAPSDVTALQPAVKKAHDAGIPVVIIDSKLEGDDSTYVSFLATDNKAAGEACAKAMIDGVKAATGKDEGKIAVMSYVAGVGSEVGRVGGFKDYIAANSKLEIIDTQYSQSDMPTALNQTTNILNAHPDLVGIFGANEPTAIGMGQAIKTAKLEGKIVAIGFDGNSVLAGFIRDGTLQAIAVQSSYNMGYLGVMTAYKVAFLNETVEKFVDTGFLMVTKDNIDSVDAKNVLY
jgi:ribose transport system substrate-binding protein